MTDNTQNNTENSNETVSATDRPSWLPSQFDTPEQFASSYKALEQEYSARQSADQSTPLENTQANSPAQAHEGVPAHEGEAAALLASVNLDYAKYQEEFATGGQLSALSYSELAAKGVTPDVANAFIAGQQALANNIRADVLAPVGGEAKYAEMVGWAADNLPDADKIAFNNVMGGRDTAAMKLAAEALKARYEAVNGVRPTVWLGGSSAPGGTTSDVFTSTKQLTAAMSDERYSKDSAYRDEVIAKLGRSKIL